VLAPPAPAMRLAVARVAYSGLGAVRRLTPPAPAMSDAVLSAAICDLLSAALLQARPPAHGAPPGSLHVGCRRNPSLRRAIHSHHPPPLSPQRSTSAHRTLQTRRLQCESRSDVGFSMSHQDGQQRGFVVVGQDGQGLLRALHRQVRRLLARRAAPNPDGGSDTPHSTPLHGVHSTTEGHLGVYLLF
jgi:hypothetical protein